MGGGETSARADGSRAQSDGVIYGGGDGYNAPK